MADVRPFRGVRIDQARLGPDLSPLVCPPFDVISPELQAELHARHPLNLVRLELPRALPSEDPDEKYRRAARQYAQWRAEQTLIQDPEPALYLYQCRFSLDGQPFERRGIMAMVRLEPWASQVVRPHEHTLPGPIEDRFRLMHACRANFSPIWLVYQGAEAATATLWEAAAGRPPDAFATDEAGVSHSIWRCAEPARLAQFHAALGSLPLYIADGHHRYTTALALRERLQAEATSWSDHAAANFVLAYLVAAADPGLMVLGIHRLVQAGPPSGSELRRTLTRWFDLDETQRSLGGYVAELEQRGGPRPAFVVWAPALGLTAIARLRADEVPAEHSPGRSRPARRLDVVALHALAIDQAFSEKTAGLLQAGRLRYAYSLGEIEREMETGPALVAFVLRRTRVDQVLAVADAGDRMPEKSTFFYPKPITGAVMASLEGEVPPVVTDL